MLSSTLLSAELLDLRRSRVTHSRVELVKSKLPRTQVRNLRSLVLRNACRPTSPDYLPNLLGTLDRDGNADSNRSAGKKSSGTN